jgi:hypothetical protein
MTDQSSEEFGSFPNSSESFGNVPKASESFRMVRNPSERSDHHTLTVREAARRFEDAGVPRTERSIINWCQPNRQGVSRLDAFFDTNERRYFITPESVTLAIQEELSKQLPGGNQPAPAKQPLQEVKSIPKGSEGSEGIEELRGKLRDLEITNRVKDHFIERLEKDRDVFDEERQRYVSQLMAHSRKVGELEAQLLQLGGPISTKGLPQGSEEFGTLRPNERDLEGEQHDDSIVSKDEH